METLPQWQPQSATALVFQSYRLNFRLLPTFIALGAICFLVPVLLLASAVVAASPAGWKVLAVLLILLSFATGLVGLAYFYAATILAIWLRITGMRAGIFQTLRRLRGNVAWQTQATGLRVNLYVMLGCIALIIPGLILYSKYILAVPAVVMEQVYGREALKRSDELSNGHRGLLIGALLFFVLINFLAGFVLSGIMTVIFLSVDGSQASLSAANVVSQLLTLFLLPASIIFPVLLYFDLRIRKEGWAVPAVHDLDTGVGVGAGM